MTISWTSPSWMSRFVFSVSISGCLFVYQFNQMAIVLRFCNFYIVLSCYSFKSIKSTVPNQGLLNATCLLENIHLLLLVVEL